MEWNAQAGQVRECNSAGINEKILYLKVMIKWTDMVWACLNRQQHEKAMQKKLWMSASIPWKMYLHSVMVVRRGKKNRKKKLIQEKPLKWVLSLRHMRPFLPFPQHSTQMWCSSQSGISKKHQIERFQSKMTNRIWEQKIQRKRDYLVLQGGKQSRKDGSHFQMQKNSEKAELPHSH